MAKAPAAVSSERIFSGSAAALTFRSPTTRAAPTRWLGKHRKSLIDAGTGRGASRVHSFVENTAFSGGPSVRALARCQYSAPASMSACIEENAAGGLPSIHWEHNDRYTP